MFEGFDHADVRVRDVAAVEAFYDRLMPLLGLPEKRRAFVDECGEWRDAAEGERENVIEYYEKHGKGARFFGVIEDRATPPTRTRIAFRLPQGSDWRGMLDLLSQIGAQSVELSADPDAYQAIFFEDPAGTRLEICWRHHTMSESRPPLPPFTRETAIQKIRGAEDAWNMRDPERVSLAYTVDSVWRNRAEFVTGRAEIVAFLKRKWSRELDYRLIKELWAVEGNRIAVRYAYESHDDSGNWYRSYGNENWEFDENGLMRRRYSSINDFAIAESERKFHWPLGPRPADHPGLSDLGL